MRHLLGFFEAVCSIAAAVQTYSAISAIAEGGDNVLLQTVAAIFAIACAVLCFAVRGMNDRIKVLEDTVGIYVDSGYAEEETEKKECPVCHARIDAAFQTCPYCENRDFEGEYFHGFSSGETFDTDNPDYSGTDFSDEEPVSANFDSEE